MKRRAEGAVAIAGQDGKNAGPGGRLAGNDQIGKAIAIQVHGRRRAVLTDVRFGFVPLTTSF